MDSDHSENQASQLKSLFKDKAFLSSLQQLSELDMS